jgi:hypothetical protein
VLAEPGRVQPGVVTGEEGGVELRIDHLDLGLEHDQAGEIDTRLLQQLALQEGRSPPGTPPPGGTESTRVVLSGGV